MEKIPIIIDCDPGVDDVLALILALSSPEIELKAICTVTGNGTINNTTSNSLKTLTLCKREDIPVYQGSDKTVDGIVPDTVPAFGDDGLGGYAHLIKTEKSIEDQDAVDYLIDAVESNPQEITIFALGPCTNLAHAIRKSKTFAKNVKRIIIMGGSKHTGNMSPVAEYNFWADPQAAKEVLNAGFKDLTMIGLDVTNKIALDASVREVLNLLDTDLSRFIYKITEEGVKENWEARRKPVAPMHDVLTIAYLLDESIVCTKPAHIDVVTGGIAKGQSIVDLHGHWNEGICNAYFAYDVDVNKFNELFLTNLFPQYREVLINFLNK